MYFCSLFSSFILSLTLCACVFVWSSATQIHDGIYFVVPQWSINRFILWTSSYKSLFFSGPQNPKWNFTKIKCQNHNGSFFTKYPLLTITCNFKEYLRKMCELSRGIPEVFYAQRSCCRKESMNQRNKLQLKILTSKNARWACSASTRYGNGYDALSMAIARLLTVRFSLNSTV